MIPIANAAPSNKKKSPSQLDLEKGLEQLKNKDFAQAANSIHNALLGFEEEGNSKGIANACDQLGQLCLERRDFDKALQHLNRAFAICQESGDELSMTYLKRKLVKAHQGAQHFDEALGVCFDLLDVYRDFNNPAGTVDTFESMAQIYLDMGERDKAADAYRTAASIHKNFKHERQAAALADKATSVEAGSL